MDTLADLFVPLQDVVTTVGNCVCSPLEMHGKRYNQSIGTTFKVCAYTTRDMVGFAFGLFNILVWIVCQAPQYYRIVKNRSPGNLSLMFLILWTVGNVANLIGAFFTGQQLLFFTAIYFVLSDVVLLGLFIYFTTCYRWAKQRQLEEEQAMRDHEEEGYQQYLEANRLSPFQSATIDLTKTPTKSALSAKSKAKHLQDQKQLEAESGLESGQIQYPIGANPIFESPESTSSEDPVALCGTDTELSTAQLRQRDELKVSPDLTVTSHSSSDSHSSGGARFHSSHSLTSDKMAESPHSQPPDQSTNSPGQTPRQGTNRIPTSTTTLLLSVALCAISTITPSIAGAIQVRSSPPSSFQLSGPFGALQDSIYYLHNTRNDTPVIKTTLTSVQWPSSAFIDPKMGAKQSQPGPTIVPQSLLNVDDYPLLQNRLGASLINFLSQNTSVMALVHGVAPSMTALQTIDVVDPSNPGGEPDDTTAKPPICDAIPFDSLAVDIIGLICIWSSGLLYFVAQIPQAIAIFRAKNVYGLSLSFLVLQWLANAFYGLSILIPTTTDFSSTEFWLTQFPFVLGSLGANVWGTLCIIMFYLYPSYVPDDEVEFQDPPPLGSSEEDELESRIQKSEHSVLRTSHTVMAVFSPGMRNRRLDSHGNIMALMSPRSSLRIGNKCPKGAEQNQEAFKKALGQVPTDILLSPGVKATSPNDYAAVPPQSQPTTDPIDPNQDHQQIEMQDLNAAKRRQGNVSFAPTAVQRDGRGKSHDIPAKEARTDGKGKNIDSDADDSDERKPFSPKTVQKSDTPATTTPPQHKSPFFQAATVDETAPPARKNSNRRQKGDVEADRDRDRDRDRDANLPSSESSESDSDDLALSDLVLDVSPQRRRH